MPYPTNSSVSAVEAPPIAEAMTWLAPGPRNRAVINLCQAVPSYPPPSEFGEEVARLGRDGDTSLYTEIMGLPPLRDALAAHMAGEYRGEVNAGDVAITAGCNQAFCVAMMALAGPGDNVILPAPYYFNHQMWLDMLKVETRHLPCREPALIPSPDEARGLIDQNTRAIVLCSPNNPTGVTYPGSAIQQFYKIAREHKIALVIDETYKDFRIEPAPAHDLFADPDWRDGLVQLYSFSKAFAMTGYRTGSLIAGPHLLAQVEKILDCIAICAPHLSQRAALFSLRELGEWKREKTTMVADRAAALRSALAHPELRYDLLGAGAFFAYLRHPFPNEPAKQVAQRLAREHDLLCLPGSMFGPGQESYLRLAFANVEADIMPSVAERLLESQG